MSDEYDFEDVTTDAAVSTYQSCTPIFEGLIKEIRELSRKKPDADDECGQKSRLSIECLTTYCRS